MIKKVFVLESGKKLDRKKFVNYFERKVLRTIRKYELITKADRVAVAASGGIDSITALHILRQFCARRRQELAAFAVEEGIPGFRNKLLKKLKDFCKKSEIPLHTYSFADEFGFTLQTILAKIAKTGLTNCYVCSILKTWLINKRAREAGFSVIATGHHIDDEAETILLNFFKATPDSLANLGPSVGTKLAGFVQRVKPLYTCKKAEIVHYARLVGLPVSLTECPYEQETRVSVRNFLSRTEKRFPYIKRATVNCLLSILPILRRTYRKEFVLCHCERCGEPSAGKICKACQILELLKERGE